MQPPHDPAARDERSSAEDRAAEERNAVDRGGRAVRRERWVLDQLRQRAANAEAACRHQAERGEAPVRSASQPDPDQVLVDREVALSHAGLLRARAHELLDRTQRLHLETAAGRRERHRGRLPLQEGRQASTRHRSAAVRERDDAAADRDRRGATESGEAG